MESNPSKTIRYDLLVVLVGVACTFAADRAVGHWSWPHFMATAAFYLTTLNFLHGKVVALDDEDYNRALIHRPRFALADFSLNVSVAVTFVFMAFYLDDPGKPLLVANLILRGIDTFIIVLVMHVSEDAVINTAQKSWLRFDWFAIAVFGITLAVPFLRENTGAVFLGVIVLDLSMDYSLNYRMYFSSAGSWRDMAEMWDAAQGKDGDIYRRRVVLPGLWAACDFRNKSVLDLGCGNGCVARAIEDNGARSVVGVDKYQNMLDAAQQYSPSHVAYSPLDLESPGRALSEDRFDVIVAVFTLQDCNAVAGPLQLIQSKLAPNGRVLVVFENDSAFAGGGRHITTGRRALDGKALAGAGRRWLIFWDSKFPSLAQSDILSKRDEAILLTADTNFKSCVTITRHWSVDSYLQAAAAARLEPAAEVKDLRVDGAADSHLLRRYELNPKFSLLSLRRREDLVDPQVRPVPLILIAGASGTGKTQLGRQLASLNPQIVVVNLDDFYLDERDARLILPGKNPDWESQETLDLKAAMTAVEALVRGQEIKIPVYNMATSAVAGSRTVSGANARAIVVEGLFAFNLFAPSATQITRVVLEGSWMRLLRRRVKRDLAEKRRGLWPSLVLSMRMIRKDRASRKANRRIMDYAYPCSLGAPELAKRIWKDSGIEAASKQNGPVVRT